MPHGLPTLLVLASDQVDTPALPSVQGFVLSYMVTFYFRAETETTLSAPRSVTLLLCFCCSLDNCQP